MSKGFLFYLLFVCFVSGKVLAQSSTIIAGSESCRIGFADIDARDQQKIFPGTNPGNTTGPETENQGSGSKTAAFLPEWSIIAWKGEKVHTRLLVRSEGPLTGISIKTGALQNAMGVHIPASGISTGFIGYVLTDGLNRSGSGCGIPPSATFDSSWVEDRIDISPVKDLAANVSQPVWLSIAIPRDLPSGLYNGTLQVYKAGKPVSARISYTVQVTGHILPEPRDWKFHLDLWQNPYSVARVHGVKPWSKAHFDALRPYIKMLADAGQKSITVSMIHDPWRGQTRDIYGSMIKWTKKKNGTWIYEYSIFDQWVEFMQAEGIGKLINCYSMEPWNHTFYFYDETAGKDTFVVAKPGSPAYEAHWRPMLLDFKKHLLQKGWFAKTAIAMDERPVEDMEKIVSLIRSVDPNWKISLAGSFHKSIEKDIYDYSIGSADSFDISVMNKRLLEGKPTTYYTCCAEGYPNTFTFSPPAESAWLGWYAAAKQYNGYLRWAYNCWPDEPLRDSRFRSWSAGDTYLVYPGPLSSVRMERMIEGIQDYEKINILRESFLRNKQTPELNRLSQVLNDFELNALKTQPAGEMLRKAKAVLDSLASPSSFSGQTSSLGQKALFTETESQKEKRMAWWTHDRFGMFIHWGLYSMPARHEWVKRYERMNNEQYQPYFDGFNPDLYNPREWAKMAKAAGMKYAVLTTKHHEGFCLFDSKYTDYKAPNTQAKKDLVKEWIEAFRAEGLKVGFYYSLLDWHHPDYTIDELHPLQPLQPEMQTDSVYARLNKGKDWNRYKTYLHNQIRELLTNYGKLDILWLDFSYPDKNGHGKGKNDWGSAELLKMIRKLQPGIIVDNRLDLEEYKDGADFATPEQVKPGELKNDYGMPFETCQTFSGSWGYFRDEHSWKTNQELLTLLITSVSKGGNLILNVGPTARGAFDYRAQRALDSIGTWMKFNDQSVYGCKNAPAGFAIPGNCLLTYNPANRHLFVHVMDYPSGGLILPGYKGKIKYAQFLHDHSEIRWEAASQGSEDLVLKLPLQKPASLIPVIELILP